MSTSALQRTLGANVRALRRRAGLSQEQFGERIDLHRTYVGGIERGERNLTLQTVERISETLGVDAASLLIDWSTGTLPSDPTAEPHLRAAGAGTPADRRPPTNARRSRPGPR